MLSKEERLFWKGLKMVIGVLIRRLSQKQLKSLAMLMYRLECEDGVVIEKKQNK